MKFTIGLASVTTITRLRIDMITTPALTDVARVESRTNANYIRLLTSGLDS